jgi:hypothetical protein
MRYQEIIKTETSSDHGVRKKKVKGDTTALETLCAKMGKTGCARR